MNRIPINNVTQLGSAYTEKELIDCDISIPVILPTSGVIGHRNNEIKFYNCDFYENFQIVGGYANNLLFDNCRFHKSFLAENANLKGKVRFRQCEFIGDTNFRNATFSKLADFWRSTFHKQTIFYKTDFLETTVFSAAEFVENVLFTYTLIEKLILFRGTNFNKGLDLALAIIPGEVGVFDIRINNYECAKVNEDFIKDIDNEEWISIYEEYYEFIISHNAEIPVENKVETFQIIKKRLQDQGNNILSIDFNVLEKGAFKEMIESKSNAGAIADKFLLWLNQASNLHGKSFLRGVGFTLVGGWLFFYLSILGTNQFHFSWHICDWSFLEGLKYYVQFILPTHKFNYIENDAGVAFYFFDFLGRIVVGYGIYQTIQAFRKFK